MSHADVQNLMKQLKTAKEQPRLYIYQYFEDLKNEIDIQCYKTLNETNKERMVEDQVMLIEKVEEFKSVCIKELSESVNEERASDFKLRFVQIQDDMKRPDVSEDELERMKGFLMDELLETETNLFLNQSMFFVKAGENECEGIASRGAKSITSLLEWLSKKARLNQFFGLLIYVEDSFIRDEVLTKK